MNHSLVPLAERMRPRNLQEVCGQRHLLAPSKPLYHAIDNGALHSFVLWGPPGTGKTTLARLIASHVGARFETLSAVLSGVKDIRAAIATAQSSLLGEKQQTVLFVDEVHRFNKAQQDAFLPYIEDGTITFVGATTENPSFEINNALLSRLKVYVLKTLSEDDLMAILRRALTDDRGLASQQLQVDDTVLQKIAQCADGDARRALSLLEVASELASAETENRITADIVAAATADSVRRFDRQGDEFYDQISALHKSLRGSDPDASLYWLARMLDGGCDPLYVARRLVRMASEDIGNADPRALVIALNAWDVLTRLGSPEGELSLAQAVAYLACAPKSNAVYKAWGAAQKSARSHGTLPVPMHLRNAPTALMKSLGHSDGYRYPHDEADAYAAGVHYFPEEMPAQRFYHPVNRGLEIKIAEKLGRLRDRDGEN